MKLLFMALTLSLFTLSANAKIGFRQVTVNKQSERPLDIALWYPTSSKENSNSIGENIAFVGVSAIRNAPPNLGDHPLVILSHGYGGNWRNLNWLAHFMASQGYIVAAVDHPGTSTFNKKIESAKQLWLRPQDLSELINAIIKNPTYAGYVDQQRVAAIGHSLGGWTVLALAGAKFDTNRFEQDCRDHSQLASCKLRQTLGLDMNLSNEKFQESYKDNRIKAVISLDLGLARGFTPESLRNIDTPVLVMAAGEENDQIPAEMESGYLAGQLSLPKEQYIKIDGATHFSFMQECKVGAVKLIAEKEPGDEIVCQDGINKSRALIHNEIGVEVSKFLKKNLYLPNRTPLTK